MIRLTETNETFSDLYEARDAVLRRAKEASAEHPLSATLMTDAKEYVLNKPLIFDAAQISGLAYTTLSIRCEHGSSIFTSNRRLPLSRIEQNENGYTYRFEADEHGSYPRFNDLYEGEIRLKKCTSPHFVHAFPFSNENERINEQNLEGIYVPKEIADLLPDGDLSPMTITLYVEWEFFTLHVLSVNRSRTKTDEAGHTHILLDIAPDELYAYVTSMNKSLQPKGRECFLSNHEVFLKEGEWCYNHLTGVLRFIPKHDLKERIYAPMLETLFVFNGMDGVTLEKLIFTGVTDKHLPDHGYLSMQANVIRSTMTKCPEAAVLTNHTRGLTVKNCEFKELGVNGILMCGISARVNIHNNYFHDISMAAVSIGDPVKASVDPKNASYDIRIDRNYFTNIGFDFPSTPAVDVFRVDGLSICHNTIEKTSYSAISVGWQWEPVDMAPGEVINIRDAEIAYNKITDFSHVLKDAAAIYVVGANCARTYSRRFNTMHHNFAQNDRIRDKVMGYYLDGASSNWTVWDNVISNSERPLYIQHNVYLPQQYTWHNRAYDIYTTEPVMQTNHHPERDTLVWDIHTLPTLDALFEEYPKARKIFEGAGMEAPPKGSLV